MSGPKVVIDRLACLLSDLEPLRPTCFLVSGRLADRTSVRCGILDSEAHHIATSKLAVADKIEEHECSYSSSKLRPSTNGPHFLWLQRRMWSNQAALVPGAARRCGDGRRIRYLRGRLLHSSEKDKRVSYVGSGAR